MTPWAVFLDIDGTILLDGRIAPPLQEAIADAQKRGHRFFLNSGRGYGNIGENILNAVAWDGVVAGIGADVRIGGRQVWHRPVPFDVLMRLARDFEKVDYPILFEGEECLYNFGEFCKGADCIQMPSAAAYAAYRDAAISKITYPGTIGEELRAALEPTFAVYQFSGYGEASLSGTNKGTGMRKALELLGIPVEHSMAIGDSRNDWDMMDAAGLSVAMGNADERTKARCKAVAPTIREHGVAWAIREFLP